MRVEPENTPKRSMNRPRGSNKKRVRRDDPLRQAYSATSIKDLCDQVEEKQREQQIMKLLLHAVKCRKSTCDNSNCAKIKQLQIKQLKEFFCNM